MRAVAVADLLLSLVGHWLVDEAWLMVTLPEADAERDHHGERRHDQARAELARWSTTFSWTSWPTVRIRGIE